MKFYRVIKEIEAGGLLKDAAGNMVHISTLVPGIGESFKAGDFEEINTFEKSFGLSYTVSTGVDSTKIVIPSDYVKEISMFNYYQAKYANSEFANKYAKFVYLAIFAIVAVFAYKKLKK